MPYPGFLSRVWGAAIDVGGVKEVDAGVDRREAARFVQVWPKLMVPRQIRLTVRPERPKCAYVISSLDDTPTPRRPPQPSSGRPPVLRSENQECRKPLVARGQGSAGDFHGRDAEAGGPDLPRGRRTHPRKDQE